MRIALSTVGVSDTVGIGKAVALSLLRAEGISLVAIIDSPLGVNLDGFEGIYLSDGEFREKNSFSRTSKDCFNEQSFDVIIPCGDYEVVDAVSNKMLLDECSLSYLLPSEEALGMIHKTELANAAKKLGINVPITTCCEDFPTSYPFLLKGPIGGVLVVNSEEELPVMLDRAKGMRWNPILTQEVVVGTEYSIAGIADRKHDLRATCQIRKLGLDQQGNTWMGTTIYREDLEEIALRFVDKLSWEGPFELEFIECEKTGKLVLLEVNPRFPAWCSGISDVNLPLMLLDILNGHNFPYVHAQHGKAFCRQITTTSFPLSKFAKLLSRGVCTSEN